MCLTPSSPSPPPPVYIRCRLSLGLLSQGRFGFLLPTSSSSSCSLPQMASQLFNSTSPRGSKPLNPNAHAFQPWKPLKTYYLPQGMVQLPPPPPPVLDFPYQPFSLPLLRYSGFSCYSAQFRLPTSSIFYTPVTYVGSTKESVVTEVMEDSIEGGPAASKGDQVGKGRGHALKKMIAPRLKRSQKRVPVWKARKYSDADVCRDEQCPPASPEMDALEFSLSGKTTVMIRNIPNKMSREELIRLLDEYCRTENRNSDVRSEYDFVYLPMDFRFKCSNKGYAFVNFTTDAAAFSICKYLHNSTWATYGTKKVCEITAARIQGKEALVGHFRNSNFECATDDYLPVVLSPPRDGTTAVTTPRIVGRRVVSNKSMRKP